MSTTTPATNEDVEAAVGAYAERLFMTGLDAFEAFTIALGRQLGWYDALAAQGPSTAGKLATDTGTDTRYVREWLEQQAVAGLVDVAPDAADEVADADARRFVLSEAAQECLIRPESLASVGPLFDFVASVSAVYPALTEAFRTGGGVPYADYAVHDAQGDFNRPAFLSLLTTEWLPAVPGVIDRLATGAPVRVAEIGSGEGWAAIAIARAWPNAAVDGFDVDEASVAAARKNAADAGVADRVRFDVCDVADTGSSAPPRRPTTCSGAGDGARHGSAGRGLAHPAPARLPRRDLICHGREGPGAVRPQHANPLERFFYAASVLLCLPVGLADAPSVATGTVMRPSTLAATPRRLASASSRSCRSSTISSASTSW